MEEELKLLSMIMRVLFWGFVWLSMLGTTSIHIKYSDGLKINLNGWWHRQSKDSVEVGRKNENT